MSRKPPPPSRKEGNNNIKQDDDEQALLASLGSSLKNMSRYEEDVLKTAEYESIPKLTGIGFPPDLHRTSLVPPTTSAATGGSGGGERRGSASAALSQVQNMQTLLGRLRDNDLKEKPNNLKFLLKQQMLLNLIHNTTQDPQLSVRPREEAKQEDDRRKRFRKQAIQKQSTAKIDNIIDPPRKKRPSNSNINNGNKRLKTSSSDNNLKKGAPRGVLKKRSSAEEGDTTTSIPRDAASLKKELGDRLEEIKKGKRSVSFAAEISITSVDTRTNATASSTSKIKRRVGIQARKKNRQQGSTDVVGGGGDSATTNTNNAMDEEEFQKRKEHLLKIRKERELRRRKRLQQWNRATTTATTTTSQDSSDEESEFKEEEEGEKDAKDSSMAETRTSENEKSSTETAAATTPKAESSQAEDVTTTSNNSTEQISAGSTIRTIEASNANTTTADTESARAIVVKEEEKEETDPSSSSIGNATITSQCPMCNEEIQASSPENLDVALSEHMHICVNSRTRGQRRSARTRAKVNYAEENNNDDMDDNEEEEEKTLTKKPPTNKRSSRKKAHNDDEDIFDMDVDIGEEEEELKVDMNVKDEEVINDDDKISKSKNKPSRSVYHRPLKNTPLDDYDEDAYEDRVDDWIENGIQAMRVMKERDANETPPGEDTYDGGLVIPAWINDRLFPYQRTGLQWMWELHRQQAGGIIGDEMGLGKTVQICAFIGALISSRKAKSVLIIAPTTLLQHWLKELATWSPGMRRILIHQSADNCTDGVGAPSRSSVSPFLLQSLEKWLKASRKSRLFEVIDEEDLETRDPASFCGTGYVCVTTYENIRRNPEAWISHNWSYVIMDEAQRIRNPDADITLVCKRLKTPHRLALSGTPIQNDLRELWSLFDFVFPGRLGTLPAFEHEFADPIKRGGYSNASPMQVQLAYRCSLILRDLINPYLLRRLKKDIQEVNRMPGKKEQVLFCRLSERQRIMYESFLQSDEVKNVMRGSTQLLGAITMLRKICNHPDLVCPPDQTSFESFLQNGRLNEDDLRDMSDDEGSVSEEKSLAERSGKLEVLAKILPLWKEQGHRVLIFCQWTKMLNIIQHFTELQGWKFGRLDGKTNPGSRQRLVDRFNDDESYFGMLCTTRTGGVGLNLTGADRIILYDPDWNPQTDAQARERAWRFGQEREVTVYRLIVAGTVEEKIYQRQIFKQALSNRILQDPRQRRLFSQRDLKDLFTLRADSGSVVAGGDGSTETSELTNGHGYVDPDEAQDEEEEGKDDNNNKSNNDDGETLRSVFQSKGLAGVFDHDIVEKNDVAKKTSAREMEAKAKEIARQALQAIETSVDDGESSFTPTWTGSSETQLSGRFGGGRGGVWGKSSSSSAPGVRQVSGFAGGTATSSSSSLLASIRKRNEEIKTCGKSSSDNQQNQPTKTTKHYTELLNRIKDFVRVRLPTSDEILQEFSSVPEYDAAVFKRLLKSVATVEKGRWRLIRGG